jgi:two-component system chemotaxis sensor kinase CheA
MNPLLVQFLTEAQEYTQRIGDRLMQLETNPSNEELLTELFRYVHTLKGNSGLFDFTHMTNVLHAAEDLLCSVRNGDKPYTQALADQLLEATDLVSVMCDDIGKTEKIDSARGPACARVAAALRAFLAPPSPEDTHHAAFAAGWTKTSATIDRADIAAIPEAIRMSAFLRAHNAEQLFWITYTPLADCFFQGDDPLKDAVQTPGALWGRAFAPQNLPPLAELDTYRCLLSFHILAAADRKELEEHFSYVLEHAVIHAVEPLHLAIPVGEQTTASNPQPLASAFTSQRLSTPPEELRQWVAGLPARKDGDPWTASAFRWLDVLLECTPHDIAALDTMVEAIDRRRLPEWPAHAETKHPHAPVASGYSLNSEEIAAFAELWEAQKEILLFDGEPLGWEGRVTAAAAVLRNLALAAHHPAAAESVAPALEACLASTKAEPLLHWISTHNSIVGVPRAQPASGMQSSGVPPSPSQPSTAKGAAEEPIRFGRRAEDSLSTSHFLKVHQAKIDRLMNLIGELTVAKNALPYLANRAESTGNPREIARGIKAQHAIIHRIADEMQDTIMQVRMVAISFVFQRFPRLVRDISRKLGKEVQLVLEGEQTEADKNIIESLADPLIHIVRNSLDHGIELPEVRRSQGKPPAGTLTIRALQHGDRVVIEIIDDGKGIDPAYIKRKALDKGLITADQMNQMTDREAVNLIFAPGFSTAEVVSDLSGRGVGMDVVRSAVEAIQGAVSIESTPGEGTSIRISLPLSMAVSEVMVVQSDGQLFGVPMDHVLETVRIPRRSIRTIKRAQTAILRGRIVPLKSLNAALGIAAETLGNLDDELCILLVQTGGELLGLLVDGFRETMAIIQKPLTGILSGLASFTGSTLLGDGSVLLILNIRELF